MTFNKRKNWRKKKLKLVYLGSNLKEQEDAELNFWLNASVEQKHQAMKEFVADELERLGMTEYGPKLLRLTSMFRRAKS